MSDGIKESTILHLQILHIWNMVALISLLLSCWCRAASTNQLNIDCIFILSQPTCWFPLILDNFHFHEHWVLGIWPQTDVAPETSFITNGFSFPATAYRSTFVRRIKESRWRHLHHFAQTRRQRMKSEVICSLCHQPRNKVGRLTWPSGEVKRK